MLKVSGVATRVMKAGKAELKSFHSIRASEPHISAPTRIRAGSGGIRGDGGDERGAEHSNQEQGGDEDVAEAGARSSGHTGGAFDVAGYSGGAGKSAEDGAEGVSKKRTARTRQLAIAQEATFLAHADKSADVVKQIHEEEDEYQLAQANFGGGKRRSSLRNVLEG